MFDPQRQLRENTKDNFFKWLRKKSVPKRRILQRIESKSFTPIEIPDSSRVFNEEEKISVFGVPKKVLYLKKVVKFNQFSTNRSLDNIRSKFIYERIKTESSAGR